MTRSTMQEMLSEHYKATRQRLGDTRTPAQPIIPIDRIRPRIPDQPDQADQLHPKFKPSSAGVIRRPPPEPEPEPLPAPKPNARAYVKILYDVALRHSMTPDDIIGSNRSPRFIAARHEAFYLLRLAGYSMLQIGRFCNRDHTTVLHGANKHEAKLNGTTYIRNSKEGTRS